MPTAIIIVSYGNPDDVLDCLRAIDQLQDAGEFATFLVENRVRRLSSPFATDCTLIFDPRMSALGRRKRGRALPRVTGAIGRSDCLSAATL